MKRVLYIAMAVMIGGSTFAQDGKALYQQECGACHMVYQPQFLPKRSWQKIMQTLQDHFGSDASLDRSDQQKITQYLLKNSGDSKKVFGEFREIIQSIPPTKTPLRISETPYFKKEHRKIPKKAITQKAVRSISNCTACHSKAQKGDFGERSLAIPNYPNWED